MITFQYPWMLLSLLCVPLLVWRFLTRRRPFVHHVIELFPVFFRQLYELQHSSHSSLRIA